MNLVSRRRRAGSLAYEALLLAAVLFVAGFVLVPLLQGLAPAPRRHALQLGLALVAGIYFTLCWRSGQTLPMKTWGMRLVRSDGGALTTLDAGKRYLAGLAGVVCFGLGFFWCLIDRDKQFLHDRLAGTRLVEAQPSTPLKPPNNRNASQQKQGDG